jgi:hypothetical protein
VYTTKELLGNMTDIMQNRLNELAFGTTGTVGKVVEQLSRFNPADVAGVAYDREFVPKNFNVHADIATRGVKIGKEVYVDIEQILKGLHYGVIVMAIATLRKQQTVEQNTVLNSLEREHNDNKRLCITSTVTTEDKFVVYKVKPEGVPSIPEEVGNETVFKVADGKQVVTSVEVGIAADVYKGDNFGVINCTQDKLNPLAYRLACMVATLYYKRGDEIKVDGTKFLEPLLGITGSYDFETKVGLVADAVMVGLPPHATGTMVMNHAYTNLCKATMPVLLKFQEDIYKSLFGPMFTRVPGKPAPKEVVVSFTKVPKKDWLIVDKFPPIRDVTVMRAGKIVVSVKDIYEPKSPLVDWQRVMKLYQLLNMDRNLRGQDRGRGSALTRGYRVGMMVSDTMKQQLEAGAIAKRISKVWDGRIMLVDANFDQLNAVLMNCNNPVTIVVKTAMKVELFERSFETSLSSSLGYDVMEEPHVIVQFGQALNFAPPLGTDPAPFREAVIKFQSEYTSRVLNMKKNKSCVGGMMAMPLFSLEKQVLYNVFNAHRPETLYTWGNLEPIFEVLTIKQYVLNMRTINTMRNHCLYGYNLLSRLSDPKIAGMYIPYQLDRISIRKPAYTYATTFEELGIGDIQDDIGFEVERQEHNLAFGVDHVDDNVVSQDAMQSLAELGEFINDVDQ